MVHVLILFVTAFFTIKNVYSCAPCWCQNLIFNDILRVYSGDCNVKRGTAHNLDKVPTSFPTDIKGIAMTGQSLTSLEENALDRYKNLEAFDADNNQIKYIHKDVFKNMLNLKMIDLGDNQLRNLPTELYSKTPQLTHIWVYKNNLTVLQDNLFKNIFFLKEIYLEENKIAVIEKHCFVNLPSLEKIDLNSNLLKTLQLNFQTDLPNIKYLYLHDNQWQCNEGLCNVINAVSSKKLWGYKEIAKCTNKDGKQWNQLKPQDFSPTIIYNVTNINKREDMTLHCEYCFVSNIVWFLNGREISSTYHQVNESSSVSTLIIEQIRKLDAGVYTCHVKNCQDCQDASINISVIYEDEATTASEVGFLTVDDNKTDDFVASASSFVYISWMSLILFIPIVVIV